MVKPSSESANEHGSSNVTYKKINFSIQEIVEGIPGFLKKLYKKKITVKVPEKSKEETNKED